MGKRVKLSELSKTVLIEQLQLCWRHFRACQLALDGVKDAKPVELIIPDDVVDMEDLELFYKCKKKAAELELVENELKELRNGN